MKLGTKLSGIELINTGETLKNRLIEWCLDKLKYPRTIQTFVLEHNHIQEGVIILANRYPSRVIVANNLIHAPTDSKPALKKRK